MGLIPWLGRFPGEGNGNPLQDSRMGSPTDRGAWPAVTMGLQSWTQLSDWTTTRTYIMLGCFPTLRAFLQNNVHHGISKHIAFLPHVSFLLKKPKNKTDKVEYVKPPWTRHPRRKKKPYVKEEISYSLSISVPERVTVMNLVLTFSVYIFVLSLHMRNHK